MGTFAPYSRVAGIHRYATEEEYKAALGDKRYPVVVFNRGGYCDTNISLYAAILRRLCESGFVVIAPMR